MLSRTTQRPDTGALRARYLGFVFSTTECGLAVRSNDGAEAYEAVPMEARASWQGWPAHYLEHVPQMMARVLVGLRARGWSFSTPGYLSQSWRQHDLAVIGADDAPLIPAPSWECNAAAAEARALMRLGGFAERVGRIEPRFVIAKLPWALRQEPLLARRIDRVMLSGDWVNGMLTGVWRLSASDALCNGLLDQRTKVLASDVLRAAATTLDVRMDPRWFPPVVGSRDVVGRVRIRNAPAWDAVTRCLRGWRVVASLGDNQATAAGCGTAGHDGIVVSLGSSGTVNRPCPASASLQGRALRFEYWNDRLLLLMLARCASWYEEFQRCYEPHRTHAELNDMALRADFSALERLRPPRGAGRAGGLQPELNGLGPRERVASIQCAIALELLDRVRVMLREVRRPPVPISRFVLTGGLTRAPLVRHAMRRGLDRLAPGASVMLNDRRGALAHKTDALGAVYNAMMADSGEELTAIVARHGRLRECPPLAGRAVRGLDRFLDACA
jgi:sugar (pentulose or hexulose) kinase